jgi:hypothetical protein
VSSERPTPSPLRRGEPREQASATMVLLRYVLPAVVVLGGIVVMALGSESDVEGGAGIVSAGLAVYAMNWLYRASVDGDRERDEEEAARAYLDAHGHWPDQQPEPRPARAERPARHSLARPERRARRP